ncbi:unnamed protein product [Calypogeia fissa]
MDIAKMHFLRQIVPCLPQLRIQHIVQPRAPLREPSRSSLRSSTSCISSESPHLRPLLGIPSCGSVAHLRILHNNDMKVSGRFHHCLPNSSNSAYRTRAHVWIVHNNDREVLQFNKNEVPSQLSGRFHQCFPNSSLRAYRSKCHVGIVRNSNRKVLPFDKSAFPSQFSGGFHQCLRNQSVRAYRSSSGLQVCGVLSSVVEAHERTLQPAGPLGEVHGAHSNSDPIQNEEAEGVVTEDVAKLRALLHLWDIWDIKEDKGIDYYELLTLADYLERLGLDIYFRQEIKSILDGVFKMWTHSSRSLSETASLLGDLQSVALAFFLLRSHEYDIQPSIFQLYKREDGKFYKRPSTQVADGDNVELSASNADVADLLNLLRASDLRFRSDEVLEDAYKFASTTLQGLLIGGGEGTELTEKTAAEARYRLKFPWAINLRMHETRQTILNFQAERFIPSDKVSSKVLSLMLSTATQLVNESLLRFQQEIQALETWNKESGLADVNVRSNMVILPAYLGMAYDMPQARFAYAREVYAKLIYFFIVLDDLFDVGASMDHLVVFNDAVRKWDPSVLEKLPEDQGPMPMKVIYKAMYDVTESWASQSSLWYGRDLLQTFIDHWMVRLEVFMNERKWLETGYKLNSDEFVHEFAKWSFSTETAVPLTYYSIPPGGKVGPSFFETRPDMETSFAIAKTGRFFNDARSYKFEKLTESQGKREFVHILMEENSQFTEKDAVQQAEQYAETALQETTQEFLSSGITHPDFRAALLSHFKQIILLYYFVDGLRNHDHVVATCKLMEPIPNLFLENCNRFRD